MTKKSLFTTIIAVLIVFLPAAQAAFGTSASIIMGALSMLLVSFFKTFYDSSTGQWAFSGWSVALIIVNLGGFIITAAAMVTEYMATNGVSISTPFAAGLVKFTIVLNAVILAIKEIILNPNGITGLFGDTTKQG